jgi:hypothetical protein
MSPDVPVGNRGRALAALLRAPSIAAAAREAQLSEKTLDRYLRDHEFLAALRAAQRRVFERSLGALEAALADAIATLRTALTADPAPPAVRIRSAVALLDLALRAHSTIDLEERVRRLEALDEPRPASRPAWPGNGDHP